MASLAHSLSAFAIIDPIYDAGKVTPDAGWLDVRASWIYGPTELESWRHQLMRGRSLETMGGDIYYPGAFHTAFTRASFRFTGPLEATPPLQIRFRAVGRVKVTWNNRLLLDLESSETFRDLAIPPDEPWSGGNLLFELETDGEPPALLVEEGPLRTDTSWQWRADDLPWKTPASHRQHRSGLPPHRVDEPEVELLPVGREGELFDFGRELFARPILTVSTPPAITVGESMTEARNDGSLRCEYRYSLIETKTGVHENSLPLGFRYLRVQGEEPARVSCQASFHPVQYRGAFACSDERLTRIWMTAAYTLRLCFHEFILDGIKRDRLPWVGDLAMSLSVNAYTFADAEIVRRSLTVLGRAGIARGNVNGIIDYSFWWVISHDLFQRYYHDPAYLASEWPRIRELLQHIAQHADADGMVRPGPETWIFIDWVDVDKTTALQIMWFWAQDAGLRLAERMQDIEMMHFLGERVGQLRRVLLERAWDPVARAWCAHPDQSSPRSRHANFLAVLSGLATPEQFEGILAVLEDAEVPPVGTPYMAGFESAALARLGRPSRALDKMRALWGRMLDHGATSFWEADDASKEGDAIYAFYGRPFGNSLCHAWSAGPAWILPAEILGIRPLSDGWKTFEVKPDLGSLTSASACVPTPYGDIQVECTDREVRIQVPESTSLIFADREYPGPQWITRIL